MTTVFFDMEDYWIIRIQSAEGFRWFKTTTKANKVLKAAEAKKIERDLIENMNSKYSYLESPITI